MFVMKEIHDPLCESQTPNKKGMLRDASPTVEFKSTPKMKEFLEKTAESCKVLGRHQHLFSISENNSSVIPDL